MPRRAAAAAAESPTSPPGKPRPPDRRFYRVADVATMLGSTRQYVYNLIGRGELPVVKVGRSVFVDVDEFEAFCKRNSR